LPTQDVIPKHGFFASPSTLWPHPTLPESGGRIVPIDLNGLGSESPRSLQSKKQSEQSEADVSNPGHLDRHNVIGKLYEAQMHLDASFRDDFDGLLVPKPPRILMNDPSSTPLELRSQLHMYAPNS
jgi:hypothetical protein